MAGNLKQWAQRFDAMTQRERVLILVTVVVAILLPAFIYVIEPAQKKQLSLTTDIARQKTANANKLVDINMLTATERKDPNDALRSRIAARKRQLERLNSSLRERSAKLVSAHEMLGLLEQVLSEYPGLTLVSVSKAEPQMFTVAGAADSGDSGDSADSADISEDSAVQATGRVSGLYRHDLSLVIEGGFFDVMAYLQALEALPSGFFWDGLDYQVERYPSARVSLQLHTLSTEQGWLGV